MRDSIMMYRTQCDAIKALPPEQFKEVVCALWDYELDGIVPEGDPIVTAMYLMAKPLIDRRNAHYESGKKGGRPKTIKPNENQTKPNKNLTEPNKNQTEPNETVKDKGERIKDKYIEYLDYADISGMNAPEYPYKEVVDYLNLKAGTRFKDKSKDTRKHIHARFAEGYTLEDFKKVIDGRVEAWKGDAKMSEYLRPSTLFGTKFEAYLNAKPGKKQKNGFANFTGRDYDYDALERMLTGVGS